LFIYGTNSLQPKHPVIPKVLAEGASGQNGQNDGGAVRWQGIGCFCACEGQLRRGKINPAQVLAVLQGKGPCGNEAFLLTAILVTFGASKVTALPRQLSGPML